MQDVDAHAARIARDGYTILENAVEPALLDAVATDLLRLERELGRAAGAQRLRGHAHGADIQPARPWAALPDIPVHPAVLPLVEQVLDAGCLVSSLSSISIDADEQHSATEPSTATTTGRIEEGADPAATPVAADDGEPVLGRGRAVRTAHQPGVADDLAVLERDERALRAASPPREASPRAAPRRRRPAGDRRTPSTATSLVRGREQVGPVGDRDQLEPVGDERRGLVARRSAPARPGGRPPSNPKRSAKASEPGSRPSTCADTLSNPPASRWSTAPSSSAVPRPCRRAGGRTRGETNPRPGESDAAGECAALDGAHTPREQVEPRGSRSSRARCCSASVGSSGVIAFQTAT